MTRQWVEGKGSPQVTECSKAMSKPDSHHTDPASLLSRRIRINREKKQQPVWSRFSSSSDQAGNGKTMVHLGCYLGKDEVKSSTPEILALLTALSPTRILAGLRPGRMVTSSVIGG